MLKERIHEVELPTCLKLDQARLDITTRSRTSRLPWRGQFSPELIEYLMDELCPTADVYFDPFCGSGTVLFEAIKRSKSAYGTEVNPAAWHLATLSAFSTLSSAEQAQIVLDVRRLTGPHASQELFAIGPSGEIVDRLIGEGEHPFLRLVLAAIVLVAMGNKDELTREALARSSSSILEVLKEMASTKGRARCFLSDARECPLPANSVDAVITSPPYINVFNYHQNYRNAVELLGWKPLQAATSEIGANRKHRQNRFLTVVQYCLDMAMAIAETARVLKAGKPFIMIMGRTSNVLGGAFRNGQIISEVIASTGAFNNLEIAERSFTNRFGERIFEDIIVTSRNDGKAQINYELLRDIGRQALRMAKSSVPDKNSAALDDAISMAHSVKQSPMLSIAIPEQFADPSIRNEP